MWVHIPVFLFASNAISTFCKTVIAAAATPTGPSRAPPGEPRRKRAGRLKTLTHTIEFRRPVNRRTTPRQPSHNGENHRHSRARLTADSASRDSAARLPVRLRPAIGSDPTFPKSAVLTSRVYALTIAASTLVWFTTSLSGYHLFDCPENFGEYRITPPPRGLRRPGMELEKAGCGSPITRVRGQTHRGTLRPRKEKPR